MVAYDGHHEFLNIRTSQIYLYDISLTLSKFVFFKSVWRQPSIDKCKWQKDAINGE